MPGSRRYPSRAIRAAPPDGSALPSPKVRTIATGQESRAWSCPVAPFRPAQDHAKDPTAPPIGLGDRNAVLNPAIVQKAAIGTAARNPSGDKCEAEMTMCQFQKHRAGSQESQAEAAIHRQVHAMAMGPQQRVTDKVINTSLHRFRNKVACSR